MMSHINRDKRINPMFSQNTDKITHEKLKLEVFSPKEKKLERKVDDSKNSHENLLMKLNKKMMKRSVILNSEYGLENVVSEIEKGKVKSRDLMNEKIENSKIYQPRSNSKPLIERRKLFRDISKFPKNAMSCVISKTKSVIKEGFEKKFSKRRKTCSSETTMDSKQEIKKRKYLEKKSEYYSNLCVDNEEKVDEIRKEMSEYKNKYERIRKIYQQKISEMEENKKCCERNLGHIFSFERFSKDIVPENVIIESSLEVSMEEKARTYRQTTDVGSS